MNTFFKLNLGCKNYLRDFKFKKKQIPVKFTLIFLSLMGFWLPAQLDAAITKSAQSFFNQIGDRSDLIWRKPMYATLYVPAITWHNRYLYDKADTDRYNERPYGLGFGFEREDENSWQSLYAMAFKDSFSKIEPIAGYGYEKRFSLTQDHNWRVGVGYTLGVTARDNWYYAPIPVALPLASINYKQVSFQGTYIPGTYGNGNVFFAWLRFQIPTGQ